MTPAARDDNLPSGWRLDAQGRPQPRRDLVRALDHLAALERGELEERYGVAPRLFSQFGLFPLAPPDDSTPAWIRENPYGSVSIVRGIAPDPVTGRPSLTRYPAGGLPRVFLVDIASSVADALKRGDDDPGWVDLGRTLTSYTAERLGLKKGGSTNKAVLEQVTATARATITFTATIDDPRIGRRRAVSWDAPKVADSFEIWLPRKNHEPLEGMDPFISLSPAFVQFVRESVENGDLVPVRRDLLAQLAGKPMAFDVLLWLGSATYALTRASKKERFYDWPYLFALFTHDYARVDRFAAKWAGALAEALRYYPDARVEIIRGARGRPGGVLVKRSPLLIEPRRGT